MNGYFQPDDLTRTANQLSRFLWTRGIWLVLLDLTLPDPCSGYRH